MVRRSLCFALAVCAIGLSCATPLRAQQTNTTLSAEQIHAIIQQWNVPAADRAQVEHIVNEQLHPLPAAQLRVQHAAALLHLPLPKIRILHAARISQEQATKSAAVGTNVALVNTGNLFVQLFKVCENAFVSGSKTCFVQYNPPDPSDKFGSFTPGQPSVSATPTPVSTTVGGGGASSPIPALAPLPSPAATVQTLTQALQGPPAAAPTTCPDATGTIVTSLCKALANPKPAPLGGVLQQADKLNGTFQIPITTQSQSIGTIAITTDFNPPLASWPTATSTVPPGVASGHVNVGFQLGPFLSQLTNGLIPAPAPNASAIPLAGMTATLNTPSPAASPPSLSLEIDVYNPVSSAPTSPINVYSQRFPFLNNVLPTTFGPLTYEKTSTNMCGLANGKSITQSFAIVTGVNLVLSLTCPLTAGYEVNYTWNSNLLQIEAAPMIVAQLVGEATLTGGGNLLNAGAVGTANMLIMNARARAVAADIYDPYAGGKKSVLAEAYAYGNYSIGGGTIGVTVSIGVYQVYLQLVNIKPLSASSFIGGSDSSFGTWTFP